MPISNAEKQARFRRKEELKKFTNLVFKEWQMGLGFHSQRQKPGQVSALLEEAAALPSGWTDDDFERAWHRVSQLRFDLVSPQDDLQDDVLKGLGFTDEFATTPDPEKLFSDTKASVTQTRALATHLISALDLSRLSNFQRAAAVMEAARHIGRATANSADDTKSTALLVCQASLPSYYDRPDWFLDALTEWLTNQLNTEHVEDLAKRLSNSQKGSLP